MKTVTKEEVERVFKENAASFVYEGAEKEILNELFQPEFKVGDWVVVLETDEFYFNSEYGVAKQIVEIYSQFSPIRYELKFRDGSTNNYTDMRHATPEEIAAATWEANKPYKVYDHGRETVYISAEEIGHFYKHGWFDGKKIQFDKYEKL